MSWPGSATDHLAASVEGRFGEACAEPARWTELERRAESVADHCTDQRTAGPVESCGVVVAHLIDRLARGAMRAPPSESSLTRMRVARRRTQDELPRPEALGASRAAAGPHPSGQVLEEVGDHLA